MKASEVSHTLLYRRKIAKLQKIKSNKFKSHEIGIWNLHMKARDHWMVDGNSSLKFSDGSLEDSHH